MSTETPAEQSFVPTLPVNGLTSEQLLECESFDEMAELLQSNNLPMPERVGDLIGDGYYLCEDKQQLVGVKFIIVAMGWQPKGFGDGYATLHVLTAKGDKLILNDGGTGIAEQVQQMMRAGIRVPLLCPRGLRRSDYEHPEAGPSTTFYLETARL